ncbi:MAG TPA: ABC transporter permease [Candidatus Eisenbergiella stercoravium]|nr:ABC transporter permease [Candidatus Eisenbergiella stercoravium]
MNRLFTANLVRLKKNKLFWSLTIAAAAFALALVILLDFYPDSIDKIMFVYPILIGFMLPAFIGIFFGTEYSDGTIRNKLMIGHSRQNVYLANLLTALVVAFMLLAAYLFPVLLLGIPMLGMPSMSLGTVMVMLLTSAVTIGATCSMHVMISMISSNKAGATVINLVLAFLSFEFSSIASSIASDRTGILADICRVVADVLPMGQAVQFVSEMSTSLWLLAVYAVAVLAICAAIGMRVFRTKNIK